MLVLVWENQVTHLSVTDRHDMTLAVTVALNPNTTNQPTEVIPRIGEKAGYEMRREYKNRENMKGIRVWYKVQTKIAQGSF